MPTHDDMLIRVRSEWKGWHDAEVRLRDLQSLHWYQPSGAPHPLVHGYIFCTDILTGEMPHDCEQTAPPHRLLVCVLKRHTLTTAFAELARRADEHPASPLDGRAAFGLANQLRS